MKKGFILSALTIFLAAGAGIYAQRAVTFCGTTEAVEQSLKNNPELSFNQQQLEEYTESYIQQQQSQPESQPPVYVIPVVFHIVHNYGPENISDAQVHDAVAILNRDFRKQNPDTSTIVNAFKSIAADCEIEFRLAQKDPSGNCHNGIDRIVSNQTYIGDDGAKLNYWNGTKYLNIWVVNTIDFGAAGYAYLPGTAPSQKDGIVMLHDYVGSIGTGSAGTSRALGHEVGHYLNLHHPWGSGTIGTSCGNDFVSDTPITKGWSSCNLVTNDVCTPGTEENVQNYMEYAYCARMFTQGQKTRMRAALTSSTAGRNNLWTTTNLAATGVDGTGPTLCAPVADFIASSKLTCENSPITFTDLSWKGTPSSWAWSFQGGTPSTSTVSNPSVTYATAGVYSVTLATTNATGSDSEIKTGYVTVYPATATYSLAPYAESFETSGIPNADWTVVNDGGVTWTRSNAAKYSGTHSAHISNVSNSDGAVDEMISPSINISNMPGAALTFKVAYVQRTSTDDDRLEVLASNDCGKTWSQRYNKSGAVLATSTMQGTTFVPSSISQWRSDGVQINPFLTSSNVKIKFKFTSGGGNNIYIDDINIIATTAGVNEGDVLKSTLMLFPNPAQQSTVLSFNAPANGMGSITLVDMLGRKVEEIYSGSINVGEQQFALNTSTLSKGMYYVNVTMDGIVHSKVLVVTE